ncbi:MAG TPA: MBL fold metallo-hydrolase [Phycisphaerae bacterium]|nr:MBL fold metallo-hydrolase [Phycisphaerae bacterium]
MSPSGVTIHTFVLGPLETNCYLLQSGQDCWVVDPSLWAGPLLQFLADAPLRPGRILLTHGHGDHIAGIPEVREVCPEVRVCCPAGDAGMLTDPDLNMSALMGLSIAVGEPDERIRPGETLTLGGTRWEVLDTSGHSPGGVSYHCPAERIALTGDALFAESIGRTDIPHASPSRLLRNIREKLLTLPPDTVVLPGHGPSSTVGHEQECNPFFAGG